jgi:hypothetical protein
MHFHIEFHNKDGMALILKEGEQSDMPKPPADMKVCGSMESIQITNTAGLHLSGRNEVLLSQQTTELST